MGMKIARCEFFAFKTLHKRTIYLIVLFSTIYNIVCIVVAPLPRKMSYTTNILYTVCASPTITLNIIYDVGEDCSIPVDVVSWLTVTTQSAPIGRASLGADVIDDFLYVYEGETLLNRFIIHSNHSDSFYR